MVKPATISYIVKSTGLCTSGTTDLKTVTLFNVKNVVTYQGPKDHQIFS